jgi:hypothetical protein
MVLEVDGGGDEKMLKKPLWAKKNIQVKKNSYLCIDKVYAKE